MTNWTLFFTFIGVAAAIAQLFRFIDFIERPSKASVVSQRRTRLLNDLKEKLWMFWKN